MTRTSWFDRLIVAAAGGGGCTREGGGWMGHGGGCTADGGGCAGGGGGCTASHWGWTGEVMDGRSMMADALARVVDGRARAVVACSGGRMIGVEVHQLSEVPVGRLDRSQRGGKIRNVCGW